MSEKKYYVKLKNTYKHDERLLSLNKVSGKIDFVDWRNSGAWWKGTKSELGKIMGGTLYRTFTHQFHPELAEELYKLSYRTTQTTEEWIESRYEFDNIWEWINPLIELVPVEDGE